MEKSPDAFRTISEVADWLGVPTHVLRFWESRFPQVKPVKRAGGRRYYRPADMLLLGGIKRLLHDDGMTIRGVQKMLREDGIRHVSSFSQPIDALAPMRDVTPGQEEVAPGPMAVDVEPEPLDNVVPMGAPPTPPTPGKARPNPRMCPLAAGEPAPDLAADAAWEAQPATAGEPDQAEPETLAETESAGTAPPSDEPEPDLAADAARALQPTPADAPDLFDEEKIPELSFLRRTPAPPDAAAREPDLFTSRRAPPNPNRPPRRAPRSPRPPASRPSTPPTTTPRPPPCPASRPGSWPARSAPITPPSPAPWPISATCARASEAWLSPLVPTAHFAM
jgi:resuscitation-promoting factor RpfA